MKQATAARLFAKWVGGEAAGAGSEIFGSLPPAKQVARGVAVLRAAAHRVDSAAEVIDILRIAGHPDQWRSAYGAFLTLREASLREQAAGVRPDLVSLLRLAESVAKATYNASDSSAPFDPDAASAIALHARSLVDAVNDPVLEELLWGALIGRTVPSLDGDSGA